jgi:hypothetical protein
MRASTSLLILALVLTGCGGSSQPSPATKAAAEAKDREESRKYLQSVIDKNPGSDEANAAQRVLDALE